jgi:hypothetical protein
MSPTPLLARKASDFQPVTILHNHITIAAAPLAIFTLLIDSTTWPSWNTFNPTATIYYRPEPDTAHPLASLFVSPEFLAPGVKFAESHSEESRKLEKNIKESENLEIVAIDSIETKDGKKGYRVVWRLLDWNGLLMKSRRIHEFVENESGGTEYNSWLELGGLFSWPLKWTSGDKKIGVLFDETFKSLKDFVEDKPDAAAA